MADEKLKRVDPKYSEKLQKKIDELRAKDKEFDFLVENITSTIEKIILERNDSKSYEPTDSKDLNIRFKVKAIPITKEEKQYLLEYLYDKYIKEVRGDYFIMDKCMFSKKYVIYTRTYLQDFSDSISKAIDFMSYD